MESKETERKHEDKKEPEELGLPVILTAKENDQGNH